MLRRSYAAGACIKPLFLQILSPIRAVLRRTAPKAATHFVAPVQ
jgi:hypothetical protein